MNIFKDLFAGVRNIFGGRSEAVQSTIRDARKTAPYELNEDAHAVEQTLLWVLIWIMLNLLAQGLLC